MDLLTRKTKDTIQKSFATTATAKKSPPNKVRWSSFKIPSPTRSKKVSKRKASKVVRRGVGLDVSFQHSSQPRQLRTSQQLNTSLLINYRNQIDTDESNSTETEEATMEDETTIAGSDAEVTKESLDSEFSRIHLPSVESTASFDLFESEKEMDNSANFLQVEIDIIKNVIDEEDLVLDSLRQINDNFEEVTAELLMRCNFIALLMLLRGKYPKTSEIYKLVKTSLLTKSRDLVRTARTSSVTSSKSSKSSVSSSAVASNSAAASEKSSLTSSIKKNQLLNLLLPKTRVT